MSSRDRNCKTVNNASRNRRSSSSAKVKAKAETQSAGSHVKKNGNNTTSQKGLKGKEKIQEFDEDSPKQLVSGNAGQDSHSQRKTTSKKAKKSARLAKKNDDHTRASTNQEVLIKEKEKNITRQSVKSKQQAEKVAPKPGTKNHTNQKVLIKEKEKNITRQSVKNEQQAEKVVPKPCTKNHNNKAPRKEASIPTYQITWDDFEEYEEEEPFGQRCCLCEVDLAYEPTNEQEAEDDYKEYGYGYEYEVFPRLPEVAVLACGHAFHDQCLFFVTPDELSRDPPCFICASLF